MPNKKSVGVVFGGRSVEHEISVLSAMQVMDALDVEKYEIVPIYIGLEGKWYIGENLRSRDFYKNLPQSISQVKEVTFEASVGRSALNVIKPGILGNFFKEQIKIDVYLPIFHGQFGEDGCIQGLFEFSNVPYAGPQVLASSIAMNKGLCKTVLSQNNIPVLDFVCIQKSEFYSDPDSVVKKIHSSKSLNSYPLFVKPVNLGSSVGVSRAENEAQLLAALAKVYQYDLEAIIEPCVTKLMEINVSVIEADYKNSLEPQVSVVEIPVSSGEFLSYEDKYMREGKGKKGRAKTRDVSQLGMAGLTRVIDPENLDTRYRDLVRDYAKRAYQILGCSGVVRFDFMVDLNTDKVYFNELNSIPGSLAFYLWDRSSPALLLSDILDRIIDGAFYRFSQKNQLKRDFGFKALKG